MSNTAFLCLLVALMAGIWIAIWLPWWWSTGVGFFEYFGQLKEIFRRPSAEERAKRYIQWFGTDEERARQWNTNREPAADAVPVADEFTETEIEIEDGATINEKRKPEIR